MAQPLSATKVREVILGLARALDADDFSAARAYLASDCVYESGGETHRGPDAIMASYASASAWAKRTFDEVRYESEVGPVEGATASVTYTDYILKAGHAWHRYRCRQALTVGEDGRIVRIVHGEIPSERAALNDFFKSCGIER